MSFTTLISTADVAAHTADPAYVVVDCRFTLDDVAWGRREYLAGHVPGAFYAHLDDDLSGTKNGSNGRHPLPVVDVLRQTLGRLGIGADTQVVAYDQDAGMYASRLWWLLRWLGHTSVAVMDGGFAKWIGEGRPTTSGDERREPRVFTGSPRNDMLVDADVVASNLATKDLRLVDARAPERYRGETEPLDKVAGHIPGAINYFYKQNLDDRENFLSSDELRRRLSALAGDLSADHFVSYCGSGVTACHNLLALEHAGLHGAKLYAGSWSEWSSDPSRPVATG